jgi:hypothetical protein
MSCATSTATTYRANSHEKLRGTTADMPAQPEELFADVECLLSIARNAGMLVMLDAQIGRERYQSVAGSVASLQRFASVLCQLMLADRSTG